MTYKPPFRPPPEEFTIKASPNTDYWRQPPGTDIRTAPVVYTTAHHLPLKSFISARVTFRAKYTSQLDQAGIFVHILPPWQVIVPPKFIKAGVALLDGTPRWSTAACEWWADWSPGPALEDTEHPHHPLDDGKGKRKHHGGGDHDHGHDHDHDHDHDNKKGKCGMTPWTTILLERAVSATGTSLRVYRVDKLAEGFPRKEVRHTLRDITWVYGRTDQDWIARVGAYAARPMDDARGGLEVEFKDLEVQWGPLFPDHHGHLKPALAGPSYVKRGDDGGEEEIEVEIEMEVEADADSNTDMEEISRPPSETSSGKKSTSSSKLIGRVFGRKSPSG